MTVKTRTVAAMNAVVDRLARANIGYNQWTRWSFLNGSKIVPNTAADCSSICGAIAKLGGYNIDLSGTFYTGNMAEKFKAAGFQVLRFTSLDQVRAGDFILNTIWHVEYAYTKTRWYSARIDEKGGITGGRPGNQTGRETGFVPAYIYSRGWNWILRPPASSGGGASKPKPSKPSGGKVGGEWPKSPLLVDGDFGPITRRAYQRLLAGIDRYKGRIDAHIGPMTVRAEQSWLKGLGHYRGLIDGQRGPLTIKALQTFLRAKGLYKGLIDGSHGPVTTRALQNYFNQQRKHYL